MSITLDIASILTVNYLNAWSHLSKTFDRLYVAQTVLDVFGAHVAKVESFASNGFMSLAFEDGKFVRTEISKEVIDKNIQRTQSIMQMVRENFEIMPLSPDIIPALLQSSGDDFADRNSLATLSVPQQTNSILYSDDLRLKVIGERVFGVQGFWTQPLLSVLQEVGQITQEDCFELLAKLLVAHYYFTAINPKLLIYLFKKNNLHLTLEIKEALKTLHGPHATEPDVVRIVSECLRQIWMEMWPFEQKIFVLDLCLKAAITNRQANFVLDKVSRRLHLRLYLDQLHHDQILTEIRNWRHVNGC